MATNRKSIKVNWNDVESIKKAEKKKSKLENDGYIQISHFGGMNETVMIYEK
jgi:hypothetical protein